jgi:hypothetical protein
VTSGRVHALPLDDTPPRDLHALLAGLLANLEGFALPAYARDAIRGVLAHPAPPRTRPLVTCHNDVNPTNLVFDGERLLLLDWATTGPNDPLYDLAAIAVFLRLDAAACGALLGAYDGSTPDARFVYFQRFIGALCGSLFLQLARRGGHAGDAEAARVSLGDVHTRLRAGTLSPATAEGQWLFGLALLAASADYAAILSTMSVA